MGMGEQNGVHRRNGTGQQLAAQIRRRIHQQAPTLVALDHDAAAGADIPRFRWVAQPPIAQPVRAADHGYARRTAGAEKHDAHAVQAAVASGAALRNRRRKFRVVSSASASGSMPRTSASTLAVFTTQAGSLRFPRNGTGAR